MAANNILIVVGTRPEIIKTAILYKELLKDKRFKLNYCLTGQHKEMVVDFLALFDIQPDHKIKTIQTSDDLNHKLSYLLIELSKYMRQVRPDLVIVQGDTLSAYAGAVSAFNLGIDLAHIEAGLRTDKLDAPFPEEGYRRMIDQISTHHFPPSAKAKEQLQNEGFKAELPLYGNTGIDALLWMKGKIKNDEIRPSDTGLIDLLNNQKKKILLTLHRNEIQNDRLRKVLLLIADFAHRKNIEVIFPVHLNPNIKSIVHASLKGVAHMHLFDPLSYQSFVYTMLNVDLIVTDSGGVQEEAPYLHKPLVVLREHTERSETIGSSSYLVGYDTDKILEALERGLQHNGHTEIKPYGDGNASKKIVQFLSNKYLA